MAAAARGRLGVRAEPGKAVPSSAALAARSPAPRPSCSFQIPPSASRVAPGGTAGPHSAATAGTVGTTPAMGLPAAAAASDGFGGDAGTGGDGGVGEGGGIFNAAGAASASPRVKITVPAREQLLGEQGQGRQRWPWWRRWKRHRRQWRQRRHRRGFLHRWWGRRTSDWWLW